VSETAVAPSKVSGHTVLAFDFGARWIGVAVGDTETRLANPLGMFEASGASRCMGGRNAHARMAPRTAGRRPAARDGR